MNRDLPDDQDPQPQDQTGRAILIVNRKSMGRAEVSGVIGGVIAEGFDLQLHATSSPEQTRDLIAEHADEQGLTLIAGGGDGMLNVFAQAIDEHELQGCCLGLLPLGTANDFATAAGIPTNDLAAALRLAMTSPTVSVDLAYLNDRPFLNAVTLGQAAGFSNDLDAGLKQRFGRWAYLLSSLTQLGEIECVQTEVVAGDFHWSGPSFAVLVGNGRQVGGGFALSTTARINDGLLDGLIVPEMPMRHWAGLALHMRQDESAPDLNEEVPVWRCEDAVVRFETPQAVQIDGEAEQAAQLHFSVDSGRLCMRLPVGSGLI